MPHLLITKNGIYKKSEFSSEQELEKVVMDNYRLIFGEYSIYLPQKMITTIGGSGTVPDAIVLYFENEGAWFVVEVELANHGVWNHIVPQITKQLVALENLETKRKLVEIFFEKVKESDELKNKFKEQGIDEVDIRKVIEDIIANPPIVVIPIDKVPADLKQWAQVLKNPVFILEFEKYVNGETGKVMYRIPEPITPLPPIEEEEAEASMERKKIKKKKLITREEFLARATKPARKLLKSLEEIAHDHSNYVKLVPTESAFSFRFRIDSQWRVLLTLYTNTVYIMKDNLSKGFKEEAVEAFVRKIKEIRQLAENYDTNTYPKLTLDPTDISEDDINLFAKAVEVLIKSLAEQSQ